MFALWHAMAMRLLNHTCFFLSDASLATSSPLLRVPLVILEDFDQTKIKEEILSFFLSYQQPYLAFFYVCIPC